MTTDLELLRRYAEDHSETAFTELVSRHLNLVYATALRQVRSQALAEEVAQAVFTALARNARKLRSGGMLSAWLYQVTRRTALNVLRCEARRQAREQIVAQQYTMNATAAEWREIEPWLDEAIDTLNSADRAAILLRYFENKPLREVGQSLGISDDAAQKRVSRAVECLRQFFSKHGVRLGASGLIGLLSANAAPAAPAGLLATLSTAALVSSAVGSGSANLLAFLTTKLKIAAGTTLILGSAVTTAVLQKNSQSELDLANVALRQQAVELAKLEAEHQQLSNLLLLAGGPSANAPNELPRLRSEVALLQQQTNQLAALREQSQQLSTRIDSARRRLQDPNVQPVRPTEETTARLNYCRALAQAARRYANATEHQDQFPTNLLQIAGPLLQGYTQQTNFSVDPFEIVYQGTLDDLKRYAHPNELLLIRTKEAWRHPDGQWVKFYAFTDGGVTMLSLVDGNFDAWEKKHMVAPGPVQP